MTAPTTSAETSTGPVPLVDGASNATNANEHAETAPPRETATQEQTETSRNPDSQPPEPPHRSRGFGPFALLLVALVSGAGGGVIGHRIATRVHGGTSASESAKEQWQCPMHPTIVMDHPGECPICGMKLVKVGASASQERKIKFYRSPMDPRQTSPTPRKDEMGMDYVPVYEDETAATSSTVDGLATIDIDPTRQQLIGLKTAEVTKGAVGGAWRTFSTVAADERRVRHVNVKVLVFVENVYANFVGKHVRRGETLFSGYSPELLAAQAEYRIALKSQKTISDTTGTPIEDGDFVKAARRKLELLDMPEAAIKRLEGGGEATRTLNFVSPIEGEITKKDVVDGMKLEAGAMPYEIVDLSNVWVLADVYETDIHRVRVGMKAKLTLKAYPNQTFEGESTFLDPVLDPATRTVKLRLEFANPKGELKPGMFGEVTLESPAHPGLHIPIDAVIDSGTRKVVFVAIGSGKFQPREVEVGEANGADVEVLSGVSEGERVVVHANFLVDSESQLRASLAALAASTPEDHPSPAPSASTSTSPSTAAPSGVPSAGKGSTGSSSVAPTTYACPMHPEVTDTKPSRCPKCGMTLVPHTHGDAGGGAR